MEAKKCLRCERELEKDSGFAISRSYQTERESERQIEVNLLRCPNPRCRYMELEMA